MNNQIIKLSNNKTSLNSSFFQRELASFFEDYKARYFKKGACVFFAGDSIKYLYLIVNPGRIRLDFSSESGRNVTKAILGQGDILGGNALIGIEKHSYTAIARTDTRVRVIPIEKVRKIITEPNSITDFLTKKIGQNLMEKEKQLESLVLKDSRTRVIEFLIDLGRKGRRVGYEQLVNNIMTHQEIADLTSTSRQTVTTLLNELRNQNIIIFNRKRMLIRDMENLAAAI